MIIEPIVLKGFRDSMPLEEIPKRKITAILEKVFQSYGFVPIDTPVLEYSSVLLGKGGGETDKQVFHFQDNGGRDVAMRFDLTVPFARFMAAHSSELAIPFKRYHMAKVWRGEKPQKGRYREFMQCDFDLVGVDNAAADFEILSMMHSSFTAMGVEGFTFHISHRGLFNTFLENIGELENSVEILRTVDKLMKIGEEKVRATLTEITGSEEKAKAIISYITADGENNYEILEKLEALAGGECGASVRMKEIFALLESAGIASAFTLDPSITRGLDYYTGIVYETFLDALPSLGSVSSGGRYNNLASLYTKEELPGVGSSIGIDRLLAGLEELGSPILANSSSSDVLIIPKKGEEARAAIVAAAIRKNGLRCDVYLEPGHKMKRVFDYTEKNRIPYSVTFREDKLLLKNHSTRETKEFECPDCLCKEIVL